jgi:hypothetical protein
MGSRNISILFLATAIVSAAFAQTAVDPKSDFSNRLNSYLELKKQEAKQPIKPGNSTEKINSQRQDAAAKMRAARSTAKQGDIFTPAIAAYFKKQIAATLSGPRGRRIRASLNHAEPIKGINLAVNESYPSTVPLQSTPPSLLKNLPQLPRELEYRIVNRALVLRDSEVNLIIDFIPNALPPNETP